MGSTADDSSISALSGSPAAHGQGNAAAAALVSCAGVAFTVTEENEVAEVVGSGRGGAARVLASESFLDAGTGLRRHFVDVQGGNEAMLFFVSVNEDQRRIVDVRRFS